MSAIAMETQIISNSQAASLQATRPFFSVRDMHAYYGESYIVQGVSLDIRQGEILALLGRNGAGKTSTLRTIARTDDPQMRQGEIWLDGKPIHEMKSYQAARAGIQLVPEDRRIIAGLTVEENLALAKVAPGHGWGLDQIYQSFPRLAERRKQEGVTLSGGEQQMLAIARALARDLKLLCSTSPMRASRRLSCRKSNASCTRSRGWALPLSSSSRTPSPRCNWPTVPSSWTPARSPSQAPLARCSTIQNCATNTWRSKPFVNSELPAAAGTSCPGPIDPAKCHNLSLDWSRTVRACRPRPPAGPELGCRVAWITRSKTSHLANTWAVPAP